MKYVKVVDDTKTPYVKVDLEGLKLPTEITEKLDPEIYLLFNIPTYKAVRAAQPQSEWDKVFKIPEEFLKTLPDEDLINLALCYMYCHYTIESETKRQQRIDAKMTDSEVITIKNYNANIVHNLETTLSLSIAALDENTNIYDKIHQFVADGNVPVNVAANVGERPQDSEKMTFRYPDLVDVTAIAILCKILAPIVGTFIRACSEMDISNSFKEVHAITIFRDIIANKCQYVADKLENYLSQTIDSSMRSDDGAKLTNLYNGFTPEMAKQAVFASMFTRKFITVNLSNTESNLMTYVNTCAKGIVSKNPNSKKEGGKITVNERKNPDEFDEKNSNDDGNCSILETESSSSKSTADFEIIISFAVQETVKRYIEKYGYDINVYNAAKNYYAERSHLSLGINNGYLLATLFGKDLCGGKSTEVLRVIDLAALVPVAQLYCYQNGFKDIVHLLSVVTTGEIKNTPTGNEMQLKVGWKNNISYRNCASKFDFQLWDNLKWDTSLEKLIKDLTSRVFLYNTAPAIWELLGEESQNGKSYNPPPTLSVTICDFIYHLFQ